jgi:hypothetical protein
MKSLLREAIDAAKEAATGATGTARELLGRSADPDVILYEGLSQADFERMAAEEGPVEVQRYIRVMESKRLRGRS